MQPCELMMKPEEEPRVDNFQFADLKLDTVKQVTVYKYLFCRVDNFSIC